MSYAIPAFEGKVISVCYMHADGTNTALQVLGVESNYSGHIIVKVKALKSPEFKSPAPTQPIEYTNDQKTKAGYHLLELFKLFKGI